MDNFTPESLERELDYWAPDTSPPLASLARLSRRRRYRLVALPSVALAAVGVSAALLLPRDARAPSVVEAHDGVLPVDTHPIGTSGALSVIAGTLVVFTDNGGACGLLEHDGVSTAIVWPAGYRVRGEDRALLDDAGDVVALPGDRVTGGGGTGPTRSASGPLQFCPSPEAVFYISRPKRISGDPAAPS